MSTDITGYRGVGADNQANKITAQRVRSAYNRLQNKSLYVNTSTNNIDAVMHKQNSHLVRCNRYLLTKMIRKDKVRIPEQVYVELEEYLEWATENRVPITWGAFCLWIGADDIKVNDVIVHDIGGLGDAFGQAKRLIHTIIEHAAMDGELNVLLYFHMNKGYFGMVEKQELTHRIENNVIDVTVEQTDARLAELPPSL